MRTRVFAFLIVGSFSAAFVIIYVLATHGVASEPLKPTSAPANLPQNPAAMWRLDARAAYDVARLPVRNLSEKSNPWVLATAAPDADAQYVQDTTWRLNEDGRDVTAPGKHDLSSYLFYTGRMQVLAELGKKPKDVSAFAEIIRIPAGGRTAAPPFAESIYDVFRSPGGTVICMVNDGYPGRSRYYPALVVPAEWERFVVLAVEYWHARPRILDENRLDTEGTKNGLRPLVDDENPFVACIAFRNLAREDLLETVDAVGVVMSADNLRQAFFALALLRNGPEALAAQPPGWNYDDRPPRLRERQKALEDAVSSAKDFKKIRGIALAAFVRYHVPPRHDPYWIEGTDLVEKLLKKASPSELPEDRELADELKRWKGSGDSRAK